ncbi:MAG: hypothetical protein GKS00_22745 [Alphaproteobacteria bacterium]|nr:hypothetical protein [Alphaproteobacteria bacterium]
MSERKLPDLKNVASYICAAIITLLGVPSLIKLIDPHLTDLVKRQYPEAFEIIYWLIKAGVYVLSFALLQSVIYLTVTMIVAVISALILRRSL